MQSTPASTQHTVATDRGPPAEGDQPEIVVRASRKRPSQRLEALLFVVRNGGSVVEVTFGVLPSHGSFTVLSPGEWADAHTYGATGPPPS